MELLFVILGGALLGLGCRRALPNRETHGVILVPAIGAGSAATLWVALTWAGLPWNGGVIWWITLLGALALVILIDLKIGQLRTTRDADQLDRLIKNGDTARATTPSG